MSIEKTLFARRRQNARSRMDAGEYKHIALGLLFLRYVSVSFNRTHEPALAGHDYSDPEDRDEYLAENVFWVPEEARWQTLAKQSKDPKIGIRIDDAMRAIETENETLKGALPKVFGKESIDRAMLTGLIDLFTNDISSKAPRLTSISSAGFMNIASESLPPAKASAAVSFIRQSQWSTR